MYWKEKYLSLLHIYSIDYGIYHGQQCGCPTFVFRALIINNKMSIIYTILWSFLLILIGSILFNIHLALISHTFILIFFIRCCSVLFLYLLNEFVIVHAVVIVYFLPHSGSPSELFYFLFRRFLLSYRNITVSISQSGMSVSPRSR